jgi:peptidoglycan biosynthesis protein MviN/MurJ (putative lipid II flippase)
MRNNSHKDKEFNEAAKFIMKPYTLTLLNLISIILIACAAAAAMTLAAPILGWCILIAGAVQLILRVYEKAVLGK